VQREYHNRRRASESRETPTSNLLRTSIFWLSSKTTITDAIQHLGRKYGFASRFVAGETLAEAMQPATELSRAGRRVILNHLGENVGTPEEARRARDSYIEMLRALDQAVLDGNISIKPTQLGLDLDRGLCLSLCQEIASAAAALRRTIEVDMEGSAYTERTLEIFENIQSRHGNAGIAIQAYLFRSAADLDRLAPLGAKIRLVKGAYQEPASIAFQKKSEVDANYRKLLDRLMAPDGKNRFVAAVATHDPALVAYARAKVSELRLAPDRYEFQMLMGIRRDLQQQVIDHGHPLRIYIPFGAAWCPYFMRRLSERPANVWFVLRSLLTERNSRKSS
jgi:proline dehydrogenase